MMNARTMAVVLLVLALMAALSGRRASAVKHPVAEKPDRSRRWRAAVVAGATVLTISMLTGLAAWRLGPADEASAGQPSGAQQVVQSTPTPVPSFISVPTPSPAPPEWRLFAGGDVLMELTEAAGIDPFAGVVPALASAELAVVNVEMAIANGGVPAPKSFVFRAPPPAANTMAAAGIDVGNLANNHALDFGVEGLYETMANLQGAGISPVGAGANAAEAYAPATFDIQGVRVGVIGATRIVPWASWTAGDGPGLASAYAEARLAEAVRSAKREHDVVIVMVHWGVELAPCPDADQQRLGAALIDAGASVVLGSHPHVLQPLVQHGGGLVAYSLGNFVWEPRSGLTGKTGMLEVRFRGREVVGHQLYPHVLDAMGAPVPAGPAESARIQGAVTNGCA